MLDAIPFDAVGVAVHAIFEVVLTTATWLSTYPSAALHYSYCLLVLNPMPGPTSVLLA